MNTSDFNNSHSLILGYILWIFGFMGAHRFYFGKPISGTLWLFTFGLLGIGWLIDLFLIPSMDRQAQNRFVSGEINYSIAWILLTFLGILGAHRFYMGKYISATVMLIISLSSMGIGIVLPPIFLGLPIVLIMVIYDFWTLNDQIAEKNQYGL